MAMCSVNYSICSCFCDHVTCQLTVKFPHSVFQYNSPAVLLYLDQLTLTPKSLALYIRLLCEVTKYQPKAYSKLLQVVESTSQRAEFEIKLAQILAVKHICDDR